MATVHSPAPPALRPASTAPLPRGALVRQRFDTPRIEDIRAEVARSFPGIARHYIPPGARVAVTAGSRGVSNIAEIVAAVVAELRGLGAHPFVVAAMGSHGGATGEGQREVLRGYGVTPETVGCEVVSSMETVRLGETPDGVPAYADRAACEADAIVLLNRVKPHSTLTGELGSGLLKMAAVGLGKRRGAEAVHRAGLQASLVAVARVVLERAPVRLGVAIVENGLDQTYKIETVPAAEIEEADRRLLGEARALLPNIPLDPLDVLVVDRIGKDVSGTGMDPNVIGMHRRLGGPPQRAIRRIVALDLSDASHGNANGVGMADVITERLRDRIDWHATYTNARTGDFLSGVKLPLACATARDAVALTLEPFDPSSVRLARISDTAHLEHIWLSEALLAELPRYPTLERVGEVGDLNLGVESCGGG